MNTFCMGARYVFGIFFLAFFVSLGAVDFSHVDGVVRSYPKNIASSATLSERIKSDFSDDVSRVRAVYTWIALNIEYDTKVASLGKRSVSFTYSSEEELARLKRAHARQSADKTMQTHKGVCQGYSNLFSVLCDQLGIESVVISGASLNYEGKIGNEKLRTTHAWNAAKIDDDWYLFDTTWGAGNANIKNGIFIPRFTDVYFMMPPQQFFLNHFPDDSKWLLCKKTKGEFVKLPYYSCLYFESGIELLSPKQGVLKMKRDSNIRFKFKSDQGINDLYYSYSQDKYGTKIVPLEKHGWYEFLVPFDASKGPLLKIFSLDGGLVSYKVEP